MAWNKIVVDTKDFVVISQPSNKEDPVVWRHEDATKVPMYRPTITLTGKANALGTNINMQLKVAAPVVVTNELLHQQDAPNRAIATASISSLQNVTSGEVALVIDGLIAGLTATKNAIINGTTVG